MMYIEFRQQLDTAIDVLKLVPGVVFAEVDKEHRTQLEIERKMRKEKHDSVVKEFVSTKVL